MQNQKVVDLAVLFYIGLLLVLGVLNLIDNIDYLDIIYLVALVCCALKYLILKRR